LKGGVENMQKMLRAFIALFFLTTLASTLMMITGCSRGPNEEQLQMLEETKTAALAAEEANADCQKDLADAESQLAEQKQKLAEMQKEKEAVGKRLEAM
jgi:hypothetical protein